MLRIHSNNQPRIDVETLPTVALIGERERRTFMKDLLKGKANVIAELESGSRVYLLDELLPDVVIIDVQSPNVNPFEAVAQAKQLLPRPEIVLIGADAPADAAA